MTELNAYEKLPPENWEEREKLRDPRARGRLLDGRRLRMGLFILINVLLYTFMSNMSPLGLRGEPVSVMAPLLTA